MAGVDRTTVSGNWWGIRTLALTLMLLALCGMAAPAAAQEPSESVMLGERPSGNGEPTIISIGIYIMDIDTIDAVRQRFSVDLFVAARWHDPRLALPEAERRGQRRFMLLDDVWTPKILFLNNRGLKSQL